MIDVDDGSWVELTGGAWMRIHFTPLDMARTQLADGPDAMWEMVNSLQALQARYGDADLRPWRLQVSERLRGVGLAGAVRHRLFPVAPHASYFPDLLTPMEAALGLQAGIEAVLSTPRHRLRAEIGRLESSRGAHGWLDDLQVGRVQALANLGGLMFTYFRHALAPVWESVSAAVDSDIARRRTALHVGGAEALLSSFQPLMRWRYPVLELPSHPSGRDVYLQGRGLRLVPSYFCRLHPLTIFDSQLPQVVVYPVDHRTSAFDALDNAHALARLLGDTRAAVLLCIRNGCSTSELARRVGISAAATSHHIAILRDAGLITSHRKANTVRHTRSRLGEALILRHLDH